MSARLSCTHCGEIFNAKRSDAQYCPACKIVIRKEYLHNYEHGRRKDACPNCGSPKGYRAKLCLSCENKSRTEKFMGKSNPNWRKGITINNGYRYLRVNHKSGSDAYRPEHHIVWEEFHNKKLPKGWVIHHLNGVKTDNRIENLLALPIGEHHKHPFIAIRAYEERIRELEEKINLLNHQINGNEDALEGF